MVSYSFTCNLSRLHNLRLRLLSGESHIHQQGIRYHPRPVNPRAAVDEEAAMLFCQRSHHLIDPLQYGLYLGILWRIT